VPPELFSFREIMAMPVRPASFVVEPLITPGDRVVVFGEFGSMKSWLLLHLGMHIAAGQPWLGTFAVPAPLPVLYLDLEMNDRTRWRRIRRLARGAGFAQEDLPFYVLPSFPLQFDRPKAVQALLDHLQAADVEPAVIIIESFRRVLVGSENEARDVSAFWRNVEPIRQRGITLLVSHHMRKQHPHPRTREEPRDRASGSTDILAGADAAFAVTRLGERALTVECVKSREAEEAPPFAVAFEGAHRGPIVLRAADGASVVPRTRISKAAGLVLDYLQAAPDRAAQRGAIIDTLGTAGIPRRTVERALTTLQRRGQLTTADRGWWVLAEPSA
jgi:RecA-family ATPase